MDLLEEDLTQFGYPHTLVMDNASIHVGGIPGMVQAWNYP